MKNNYKIGAIKRMLKVNGDKPGDFISKVNEMKIKSKEQLSKKQIAIRGLV